MLSHIPLLQLRAFVGDSVRLCLWKASRGFRSETTGQGHPVATAHPGTGPQETHRDQQDGQICRCCNVARLMDTIRIDRIPHRFVQRECPAVPRHVSPGIDIRRLYLFG